MCDSSRGGRKDYGKELRNTVGWGQRENTVLSLDQTVVTVRESVCLLEQRAAGGIPPSAGAWRAFAGAVHQPASKDKSLWDTFQSLPRSKYVWAVLPAATILGFPIAALIDMNLLTCDPILTALEPQCLVVVMWCTWWDNREFLYIFFNDYEKQSLGGRLENKAYSKLKDKKENTCFWERSQ